MENFGLSPDKVEKLYHQALRLNHLTSQVHLMPTEKKSNGESSKVKARPSTGKISNNNNNNNCKATPNSAGTMRTDQYSSLLDQSLREWEVFKYGDDYGFKDLPTDPTTSSPKDQYPGQYSGEHNNDTNNRISSNLSDNFNNLVDDDAFSGDFISVLNNVEVIGEKFVKEIQAMKKLFNSNDTFKNQFEKVFCTLRREKIRLEIDLLQARRCIESLKNQLVIVQEEADQCRRELDEERHCSNLRIQKMMRRFNDTKNALDKTQKQLAIRRINSSKESSKSTMITPPTITPIITIKASINKSNNNNNNSQHDSSPEGKSYGENGEAMEEPAGSPESCNEQAQDDLLPSSRNGKSPTSNSSVDLNSNLNGECDLSEELDLSTNHADHPMNGSAACNSDSFEVTLEEMGLDCLPNETNDPCICAAIVMNKGRIILHNLKRSEYLATIYEYRKYRPEFTDGDNDSPMDPNEEDYDFVNMLPGSWFNSNIDGWFIGSETPEEKNRNHPRLSVSNYLISFSNTKFVNLINWFYLLITKDYFS